MKIVVLSVFSFLIVGVATFAILSPELASKFVQQNPAVEQLSEELIDVADFEQPFVMLAMNSSSRLMSDFRYIASKSKIDDLQDLTAFAKPCLDVLDSTKPMGLMVYEEEEEFEFVACLPVSDMKGLEKLLSRYGKATECALGLVFKPAGGGKYLIKHIDGYAFVTETRKRLDDLPSDPAGLFNALVANNTVAVKVDMTKIPKLIKDAGSHGFKRGVRQKAYRENNLYPASVLSVMEKATDSLIYDSEKIVYYLNVDQQTDSISLETNIVANEGSLIADAAAANLEMEPSMFGGFQNDINSAMRFHWRSATMGSYFSALKADAVESIEKAGVQRGKAYESDPEKDAALLSLEKMLDDTIASNRLDVAANFFLKNGKGNLLVAIHINDTTPLKEAFESALNNEQKKIILNVDQHNDVVFHEMLDTNSLDYTGIIPEPLIELTRKSFIGIGDQAVYIAMGHDSLEILKQCIDDSANSPNDNAQSSLEINFRPLLDLNDGSISTEYVDTILETFNDGDELAIKSNSIERGFSSQVKLDMGVVVAGLKIIEMIGAAHRAYFSDDRSPSKNVRVTRPRTTNQTRFPSEQADREFRKGFQSGLEKSLKRQGNKVIPNYGKGVIINPYAN